MNQWRVQQRPGNWCDYLDFEREVAEFSDVGRTAIVQRISFDLERREAYTTFSRTNDDGNTWEMGTLTLKWKDALATIRAQGTTDTEKAVMDYLMEKPK